MRILSECANNLTGQSMFQLLAKAINLEKEGRKIIHYEIGDPNFLSPYIAKHKLIEAVNNNKTHYTSSSGDPDFIESIRKYCNRIYGFLPDKDQVVVAPANALIDFICRCVANKGDSIIYPDPGFVTYYSVIKYNGFNPSPIILKESNDFRMSGVDIKENINKNDNNRLIIINSSHNPTGSIMTEEDIKAVYDVAEEYDTYVLSDEVYSRIIYDGKFFSPSLYDKCMERTIMLHSMSKTYSMSGWRCGFAVGPKKVIEKVNLMIQTILSCCPPFIQIGAEVLLNDDVDLVNDRISILKDRRDMLINGLNSLKGVKCKAPHGSFYAFPNIQNTGMSSDQYCQDLLDKTGVCVLPGNCFGSGGEGYVRLCYASVTADEIIESLEQMRTFHDTSN